MSHKNKDNLTSKGNGTMSAMSRITTRFRVIILMLMPLCGAFAAVDKPVIESVTAQQRYPWNGLVDVVVTFKGSPNDVAKYEWVFTATNSATKLAIPVNHITRNGGESVSDNICTWKFVWDAMSDAGAVKIDDVTLTVEEKSPGGVQLWEDGPCWAECNVGATKPEEYGYYFWWGDPVGYKRNSKNDGWVSVANGESRDFDNGLCSTEMMTASMLQSAGYIDSTGNLVAAHDAARARRGAPWRMPTAAELVALTNNCTTKWTTRNGVWGRLVTGCGTYSSKSIFLPAAGYGTGPYLNVSGSTGYYWTSTPKDSGNYDNAWLIYLASDGFGQGSNYRIFGCPVRPLREFAQYSAASTHLALDCRTGARAAGATETIRFSPAWETAVDGATATVTMDGTSVTNATEAGTFEWTPMRNGTYSFAHIVSADGTPIGETLSATFVVEWFVSETPIITPESAAFDGASQEVTISCATEGATVYYTIDGSEPSAANGRVYKGPFSIYDSVTVKAVAVKEDWKDSAVASAAFTKNNGLSAAINMYDYLPDNDANCPWTVDAAVSHDGVSSVRSGMLSADGGTTTMKVTVKGAGKLSFWWKAECEEECDGEYYDYGAFRIGTADPLAYIAGDSGWQRFETEIASTGKHILKWEYHKDDAETIPRDCIWVDQVQWVPADDSGHTLTTGVPVPYSWLESYGFGVESDFESAAKMKFGKVDGAGRAMSVEDDYVAGTDPTNLESKLTATIKMGADGKPILSWKPPLNGETAEGAGIREGVRRYSVLGKRDPGDVEEKWEPVAEGDESGYRFFKVKVEMP